MDVVYDLYTVSEGPAMDAATECGGAPIVYVSPSLPSAVGSSLRVLEKGALIATWPGTDTRLHTMRSCICAFCLSAGLEPSSLCLPRQKLKEV